MTIIVLAVVGMILVGATGSNHVSSPKSQVSGQPLPIPQGPMGVSSATTSDPYWFQQGAIGDQSTHNSVGASVMIRTVYDKVNNDAHSYWVGSILSNGAFVQVGYYNGLTTTNQYYCCAWFYEFFPPNNSTSPPIIGPAGSAGPIGSWHTYTMNSTSNGVWAFYMDNQYLGSSTPAGQKYELGSSNTGNNPVAALSEVASTTARTDVIGPAEFKNLQYETQPNTFQSVPTGNVHIGCGLNNSCLPNPYGVAEIEKDQNIANDFLAGSNITSPWPDECGNPTTSVLWSPTLALTCNGTKKSFTFLDLYGNSIIPTWISLSDSTGAEIFYSDNQNYQNLTIPSPSGQWTINKIWWHATNVATGVTVSSTATIQPVPTNVLSVQMQVIGYFYSLPVKDATVIMYLPDSTNETAKTDNNGQAVFTQLPIAVYTFHVTVPYGVSSTTTQPITNPGSITARVFSLPELITLVIPPILIAIVVAIAVARKERQRQAVIQAQPIPAPALGASFCRSCGQPLSPTANFCTSCGTPRIMTQ
jgi:hypothetical protein